MPNYLPSQFSGPLVSETMQAMISDRSEEQNWINYLGGLSIATAEAGELEWIGDIIGFPWPTTPSGIFANNIFSFGSVATFPTISAHGFGSTTHSTPVSGVFASASPSSSARISIESYRELLPAVASLKYNGLSIESIDTIASFFAPSGVHYTLDYAVSPPWDIIITYSANIGPGPIFVIDALFQKFCTDTQVTAGVI